VLGGGGVRAGGLVGLDIRGDGVPGSFLGRFLLGGEPVGDIIEHFGERSDWYVVVKLKC
jgi:hypothetical protein